MPHRITGGLTRVPPVVRGLFFCLTPAVLALGGCLQQTYDNPAGVVTDRERGVRQRLDAASQIGPIAATAAPDATWKIFSNVVWSDRHPDALRTQLMDELLAADAAKFWSEADDRIVYVDSWPVMEHLFKLAVDRNQQAFTLTLVRSWARVSQRFTDDQRPERDAIAKLNPGVEVDAVLWNVFTAPGSSPGVTPAHRAAAWTILHRLQSDAALKQQLQQTTSDAPMVSDLRTAAAWLDVLPANREQLVWLMDLRSDAALWQAAAQRAAQFTPDQRRGLALRHLPLLAHASPAQLQQSTRDMQARLASRLRGAVVTQRRDLGGVDPRPAESFLELPQPLAWGDLLAIDMLLDQLARRDVRQAFFAQADADLDDTTTEAGGILTFTDGPVAYAADLASRDNQYVAPLSAIMAMHRNLAHYHFHAQQHDNAAFAGPGLGDLRFAETFGGACVVLTFLDAQRLDVDYYLAAGVIVDLGAITR